MTMKNPVHPGEILREDVLADLGLSVGEAASRLGISRVTPVSYTHLDVYKRQGVTWPFLRLRGRSSARLVPRP